MSKYIKVNILMVILLNYYVIIIFRLEFFKREINVFSKSLNLSNSQVDKIDFMCRSFLMCFRP